MQFILRHFQHDAFDDHTNASLQIEDVHRKIEAMSNCVIGAEDQFLEGPTAVDWSNMLSQVRVVGNDTLKTWHVCAEINSKKRNRLDATMQL